MDVLVVAEDGDGSLPHPGGDGLVVEDDRSTTSEVHWLTILIDHIVVHSDDGNDDDNDNDNDNNGYKDLSKMESLQRPRTVTRLTLAGTWKKDQHHAGMQIQMEIQIHTNANTGQYKCKYR